MVYETAGMGERKIMPVKGRQMQPREIAELCHNAGWRDEDLVVAVAVCLSESGGYPLAWHDNLDSTTGVIKSRDVGLFQINIPGDAIGTEREEALYDPIANVATAMQYWKGRKWQPWYGYTNGYATSTEWWHWSTTKLVWVPTGRYLHRAVRGVSNYYARKFGLDPVPFLDYYSIPKKPVNGA
jgi:hypothetical protein